MAPPVMSPEEAQVFLQAKGQMSHVSLFAQSPMGWLRMVLLISLAWLGSQPSKTENKNIKWMAGSILSGIIFAILLSSAALWFKSARLAQFQPMRIFTWITFFSYLLLIIAIVETWKRHYISGILLLAVFVMEMFRSLWAIPFMLIGIADQIIRRCLSARRDLWLPLWERSIMLTVVTIISSMIILWLSRHHFPSIATFHVPLPIPAGIILLGLLIAQKGYTRWRPALMVSLLGYVLLGASIHWHRYYDEKSYPHWNASLYKARRYPEWDAVRLWCRDHTPKNARFIIAGGYGNFRLLSWRTGLGRPMSALAWVDPKQYVKNGVEAAMVNHCWTGKHWNLECLKALAAQWNARYIVLQGTYQPKANPVFRVGDFSIIDTYQIRVHQEAFVGK
jgi:hypothetical protein